MKSFENLRRTITQIKQGKSGERFIEFYRFRQAHRSDSVVRSVLMLVLAGALIGLGILGFLLPILPGFLFFIPGVAILVARSKFLARTLDGIEAWFRKVFKKGAEKPDKGNH